MARERVDEVHAVRDAEHDRQLPEAAERLCQPPRQTQHTVLHNTATQHGHSLKSTQTPGEQCIVEWSGELAEGEGGGAATHFADGNDLQREGELVVVRVRVAVVRHELLRHVAPARDVRAHKVHELARVLPPQEEEVDPVCEQVVQVGSLDENRCFMETKQ